MTAPRFYTNPFVRDAELQHVVSRKLLPSVMLSYVLGETEPRRERATVIEYSGGHHTFDVVPIEVKAAARERHWTAFVPDEVILPAGRHNELPLTLRRRS